MHRLLIAAAVAASLTLAACGEATTTGGGHAAATHTVSVKHVDGTGDVLVDSSGLALYTPDQEAGGSVRCTGGCTSFWMPVKAGSGTPSAADGVGKLTVIKRPDGERQVALSGKPLYTFSEDAPGKITGNGFHDKFGATSFTWHVLLTGGRQGSGSGSGSGSGGYNY